MRSENPVLNSLDSVLCGKREVSTMLYACLLAGGNALIEDVPGVGKTTLAHAMARAVGLQFKRIQCTNDTMPSDILGISIWNPGSAQFEFKPGPVFTEALVVDEINRAPPKTQSALLEAMEEKSVTTDGVTYALAPNFWVVATQNPTDNVGTANLPESQLDRFLVKVSIGYPDEASEKAMLRRDRNNQRGSVRASGTSLEQNKLDVQSVLVNDSTLDYLYRLISSTRTSPAFKRGLSPRAAHGLLAMSRAWAWLHGRNYVTPDDVKAVFPAVANHRVQVTSETAQQHVDHLLHTTIVGS